MQEPKEKPRFFLSKYLNKVEIIGWSLFIFSLLTLVFAKQLAPEVMPYAWIGAIIGAGMLGWGMKRG